MLSLVPVSSKIPEGPPLLSFFSWKLQLIFIFLFCLSVKLKNNLNEPT